MDYEKFFKDFVPKTHLPSDYGGDLDSIETLHTQQIKEFMDMREYFLMEEQQANCEFDQYADEYDEDRRNKLNAWTFKFTWRLLFLFQGEIWVKLSLK